MKISTIYKAVLEKIQMGVHSERLFVYDQYWRRISDSQLAVRIRGLFADDVQAEISDSSIREVIRRIKTTPRLQLDGLLAEYEDFVHVQNGVFAVREGKIKKTHNFSFFYQYDFAYIPQCTLDDAPVFRKFLCEIFPEETERKVKLLLEIFGYCLSDYTKAKKAFFFIGVSNSGKSTLLEVLQQVFPPNMVTAIPLQLLSNRFNLACLQDSRLNVCTELSEKSLSSAETFKMLTAAETVTAENKGKDPFEFCIRTKSINAGNLMPNLGSPEGMDAMLNRIVLLMFEKSIEPKEQDKKLQEKIWEERDAIFSLALDELTRLVQKNFCFEEPLDSQRQYASLRKRFRVIEEFLKDRCVTGEGGQIHLKDLYDEFVKFCNENLLEMTVSKRFFSQKLDSIPQLEKAKFRVNGKHLWGYKNVRFRERYEQAEQKIQFSQKSKVAVGAKPIGTMGQWDNKKGE